MKSIVLSFLVLMSSGFLNLHANGNEDNPVSKNKKYTTNSKVQKANNKLYFNLNVSDDTEKGFYVLFKFFDKDNSIPVSVKEAIVSNPNIPIMYSFVEDNIPLSDTHYKIVKITEKGKNVVLNYDYTSEATVSSEEN